jgi:hypothetical protein
VRRTACRGAPCAPDGSRVRQLDGEPFPVVPVRGWGSGGFGGPPNAHTLAAHFVAPYRNSPLTREDPPMPTPTPDPVPMPDEAVPVPAHENEDPCPAGPDGQVPVECLPWVPENDHMRDGWQWMSAIEPLWHAVGVWGSEGWDLGSFPYVVVAHYDDDILNKYFGLAVYTEGDVNVQAYEGRAARDAATDELALHLWEQNGSGPPDAPASRTPAHLIPERFRHPYRHVGTSD